MEALEEVVVIGYGTMKKSDLTGSLSSVKNEDLTAYAVPNPVQALQVRTRSSKLHRILLSEGNFTIRIRGANSIKGSNDPSLHY